MLLSMLGIAYEKRNVDQLAAEDLEPSFETLNPLMQVPVLVDGETALRDSQAILFYLAAKYGRHWLPDTPEALGHVTEWLSFASNEIASSLQPARLYHLAGDDTDIATVSRSGERALYILELHLQERQWLVDVHPTIADLACFPSVALAHKARISLVAYPAVRAWIDRIKGLPGYVGMPGLAEESVLDLGAETRFQFMSANWMALARKALVAGLNNTRSVNRSRVTIEERLHNVPQDQPCSHRGKAGLLITIESGNAEVAYLCAPGKTADIEISCEWEDAKRAAMMHAGPELSEFRAWQMSQNRISIRGDLGPFNALLAQVHEHLVERTEFPGPAEPTVIGNRLISSA